MINLRKTLALALFAATSFSTMLNAQCILPIGTSGTMLTSLNNRSNSIIVNNDLNTVMFIHRNDPSVYGGDNGIYRYDISTDNGATWQLNQGGLNVGSAAGVNAGRFPQVGLYNPSANTNPANARLVYHGPTIAIGASGDWNGYVTGSLLLDGAASPSENYNQAGVVNTLNPGGFCQSTTGTFWTVDVISDNNFSGNGFRILKGTYSSGDVTWAVNREFTPDFNTDAGGPQIADWNMAFDPTGMKGWMVALTHLNGLTGTSYRPVFYNTSDGGVTWNGPVQLDLNSFSSITSLETNPTCGTEVDIEVDINGNPHALIGIFRATQGYYGVDGGAIGHLFDFNFNGTDWNATNVGPLSYHSIVFPGSSFLNNRPQISRSDDGSKMVFTWAESDIPSSQGVSPNFKAVTYDVASGKISCPVIYSLKCPSALDGQMYQTTVSPNMIEDGGIYTVPVVLTIVNASGQATDPSQHYYMNDLTFTAADFSANVTPTYPTITANGPTTFCTGGSVELTAGNANSYLWSTGETTQTITATGGNYWVVDPTANFCISGSNSITVTQVESPFLFPSSPTICPGGSVDIFIFSLNTVSYNSYLWTNGATTAFITVTTAGTYDVLVDGCPSAGSVEITAPGIPANDNICNAQLLKKGVVTPFNNSCASAEPGEQVPPIGTDSINGSCYSQDGWCDAPGIEPIVSNSVWFSFIAPLSGAVQIKATNTDFYGNYQLALYSSNNNKCNGKLTLVGANDDDLNDYSSSTLTAYCLQRGRKYFVQVDGAYGSAGAGTITATPISNRVLVCYQLRNGKYYTLEVSRCFLAWHLAHGAVLGACPGSRIEDYQTEGEITETPKIIAYPNPSSDKMTIAFSSVNETNYTVTLTDVMGRIVLTDNNYAIEGDNQYELNLNDVANGIYMVMITTGDTQLQTRIIKN